MAIFCRAPGHGKRALRIRVQPDFPQLDLNSWHCILPPQHCRRLLLYVYIFLKQRVTKLQRYVMSVRLHCVHTLQCTHTHRGRLSFLKPNHKVTKMCMIALCYTCLLQSCISFTHTGRLSSEEKFCRLFPLPL